MLKISDILKKNRKKRKNDSVSSEKKAAAKEVRNKSDKAKNTFHEIKQAKPIKPGNAGKEPPSAASPAKPIQFKNTDNPETVNIYKKAISLCEEMEGLSADKWKSFSKSAKKIIDRFIDIFQVDENALLRLFFGDYYSFKGYLYQHSVNVCILSLYLSKSLKYSRDELQQVGIAALLHDIGLIEYDHLISQNKRFGKYEYDEVKNHPIIGRNILEKINSSINIAILDVISQEHERLDGSGYPQALEEKDISEKARLLGMVDSYEAMMHVRPYRDKFKSEDVIKFFTQHKVRFEYKFIKTLIDLIGVFPVTTAVKLNTREMGVVIKQNYQMPFKPIVNITHNAQGQIIDSSKAVDLASNFSIYIQECFTGHKIKDEKKSE